MKQSKLIYFSTLLLLFILSASPVHAAADKVCSPFKNTNIDGSLIASMLKAADHGYLYQIKSDSSKMGFCVESPIGLVKGNFQNFEGGIALNGNNTQSLVAVDVDSLETNKAFISSMLKGDDFFDVNKYPDLLFVSTSFEWTSETKAILKGDLTMHGVTKAIAFYVEVTEIDGDLTDSNSIMVTATTTVQRSEFGMHTLSNMVSDKVSLCMTVEAHRYDS